MNSPLNIMTNDQITCNLYPNANKLHEMHPYLRGRLSLAGDPWTSPSGLARPSYRTRMYHSATISDAYHKGAPTSPPLAKGVKIYEFRKKHDSDPDFLEPRRV